MVVAGGVRLETSLGRVLSYHVIANKGNGVHEWRRDTRLETLFTSWLEASAASAYGSLWTPSWRASCYAARNIAYQLA